MRKMIETLKKAGSKKPTRQELEAERDDFKDKWLRAQAEFENFRKRTMKEKEEIIRYANEKIILDICDVYDNLERALETTSEIVKPKGSAADKKISSFMKGVELIYQQFNSLLKKYDVVKLDVVGKEFDPHYHEALSALPSEEPQNTIIAVIQNGYMMKDKVIKHSRVVVSNGEKPTNEG